MGDDGELLLAYARRGDVKSLSTLVVRHSRWLFAIVRGLVAADADAEDVLQDVWVRVIRSCASYRGGSVRAYLSKVARTAVIDRHRRLGRPTMSLDAAAGDETMLVESLSDTSPTPDSRCESRSESDCLRAAVRSLPKGPREVLLLRIEAEMPFKDIAKALDVPLGTALTWMHVAKTRLKRVMGGL